VEPLAKPASAQAVEQQTPAPPSIEQPASAPPLPG
jgi:alanine racemase